MSRPWMPLYVADYLADTGHLSTFEHGAYLLLIMHYWQNEGLPSGDAKLARICRMTAREWATVRSTLADFFGEDWRHARIDRELSSAREAYERRAKAGQKGGIAQAMLKRKPSKEPAGLKQSQPQSQDNPSREQGYPGRDVGLSHRTGRAQTSPSPDPTAWDPDAPFGRTAAGGGR